MILLSRKVFVGALALGLLSCTWFGVGRWNSASAATPVYYVSNNGNDENSGTSENAAFRTIQKAADVAKAGSTILVRGGIYNESVTVRSSGSSLDGFISFENYPGETPVIDGTDLPAADTGLFNIADKSYIRLKGFEIRNLYAVEVNDTPIGVHIKGTGHHIEVRDNYIHHIESGWKGGNAHGIAVFGTSADPINNLNHIVIDHNEVANLKLGLSEAVAVNGNVDTFEVTNNKVHHNNNIGIVIIGHEGISPVARLDQARNGIVRGNAAYNNSSNSNSSYNEYSAGGIYVDGGKDLVIEQNDTHNNDIGIEVTSEHAGYYASGVTVRNNLIYRNVMSGITLGGYDQYRGYIRDCFFLNNTIYHNDTLALNYGQITFNYNTQNNVIKNNVIYGSDTNVLISNPFTENAGNVLDANLYFTTSGVQTGLLQWKNVMYTGFVNYKRLTGNDPSSVFADPKFMNLTAPDLQLLSDSPAINAGQHLTNIGGTDFAGKTRIQGGTVDIGAFETATAAEGALQGRKYPLHTDIIATTFWVGELFDPSAPDGSQVLSTYDSEWMTHYGGCDGVVTDKKCQTERRTYVNDFFPTSMTPKMNPFYLDLPFDDLHDEIAFKQRAKIIPWANDAGYSWRADDKSFSYLKSRWVKLLRNGCTCYGQIEDAGPGQYHDAKYVFGSDDARPANTKFNGAGMDVSPALNGCLGFSELNGENDKVDWQFVDDIDVPAGPWKTFAATAAIASLNKGN